MTLESRCRSEMQSSGDFNGEEDLLLRWLIPMPNKLLLAVGLRLQLLSTGTA